MFFSRFRLWLLLVLLAIPSISRAQADPPEVVLVRGGAGYWPGVNAIASDLADHGFDTKTTFGSMYARDAAEVAADYHSGRRNGFVTIVGYSSGADYACKLCRCLENRGVPVATLVLMESTLGTPVPGNVELCVNLYESRPATDWIPAFRGIPVEALSPSTEVVNLDVRSNDQLQWLTAYNHFTIASGAEMRVLLRNLLLLRRSQYEQQQQQIQQPQLTQQRQFQQPPFQQQPPYQPLPQQQSRLMDHRPQSQPSVAPAIAGTVPRTATTPPNTATPIRMSNYQVLGK